MSDDFFPIAIAVLVLASLLIVPALVIRRITRRLAPLHPVLRGVLVALTPALVLIGIAWTLSFPRDSLTDSSSSPTDYLPRPSPPARLPTFPWPPPQPSARVLIPASAFRGCKTFGELSASLDEALTQAGYVERSYYAVPGGIGVVTRLERIYRDGRPYELSGRWQIDDTYLQTLSLASYLRALFTVGDGYYRVIVFAISSVPFGSGEISMTSVKASTLLARGFNTLPEEVAAEALPTSYACTCLIYEFQRDRGMEPVQVLPGRLGAKTHLAASGLWVAFGLR